MEPFHKPQFLAMFDCDSVRQYMPPIPVLLSASSFESLGRKRGTPGRLPVPNIPPQVPEIAVDPGGFVAQHRHGGYRFTWDAYEAWLFALGPRLTWAAFPDLPCEPELAADAYAVRARQEQTLEYAHDLWGTVFDSSGAIDDTEGFDYRVQFPWTWVATVQGRNVDEYVWHAEQLAPLLDAQDGDYWRYAADPPIVTESDFEDENVVRGLPRAVHGAHHSRVAIGSLCQRTSNAEVVRIVQAVHEVLPWQRFHLWGVKLGALEALRDAGLLSKCVRSLDSSAWNGRFKSGVSAKNAAQAAAGMSQRQYSIQVSLPAYLEKVERELVAPHTERLF